MARPNPALCDAATRASEAGDEHGAAAAAAVVAAAAGRGGAAAAVEEAAVLARCAEYVVAARGHLETKMLQADMPGFFAASAMVRLTEEDNPEPSLVSRDQP